jgi:hypothetical protein
MTEKWFAKWTIWLISMLTIMATTQPILEWWDINYVNVIIAIIWWIVWIYCAMKSFK